MTGHRIALVQGASRGLGLEFVRQLLEATDVARVIATCRDPERAAELHALAKQHVQRLQVLALDVSKEESVETAAKRLSELAEKLHLVLNVAGILHGKSFGPEKRLAHVDPEVLHRVFEVNAFGPLLVAKHLHPFLRHEARSVFASLSARVGSISDNRLGGWYAYRASKAAQNMFTKNLSIELGRIAPEAIVVGLHPGTVDTDLSKPFQSNVPEERLFSPTKSVQHLLRVIDGLSTEDTGKVFAWDGSEVLP